jgi:5-(carboxyamino)imidazole ribonucleotide synthase
MQHNYINSDFKLGILGGGQLGKMMALAVGNWHLPIYFLDQSKSFPAGPYGMGFTEGNFKNYQDVYDFGKDKDVLSIEIEHVNTEALLDLEAEGVIIHPAPRQLNIIKDKGLQKQFYADHQLPTAPFALYKDKKALEEAIKQGIRSYPFVQKARTAGYDGKGVAVINDASDLPKLLDGPSMVEDKVAIRKELAVIVARNPSGDIQSYPTVEMEFNPVANLVEFLISPAQITAEQAAKAQAIAKKTVAAFGLCGLLAVELFLDLEGNILINEVAPRPHNSGHHTIDSSYTSQFEQHIRAILDLPLGSTKEKSPVAIMVNLLGADGHKGPANYQGLADLLEMEGVYPHIYGKEMTKPFRKMGHATILGTDIQETKAKAKAAQAALKIISK